MKIRAWLRYFLFIIPFSIFVGSGLMGVNFGSHWDEHTQMASVGYSLYEGRLLPAHYAYPSMAYWLILGSALPSLWGNKEQSFKYANTHKLELDSFSASTRFKVPVVDPGTSFVSAEGYFRARSVFIVVSALGILWTYLTILTLRGSALEALFGACLIGLSWEFAYHSRWVAPDAIVMQFGALTLCALVLAAKRSPKFLSLAAAAAGMAASTKYPAGALILPVGVAAWRLSRKQDPGRYPVKRLASLAGIFALAYLCITPGTLLDPFRFWADLENSRAVYLSGTNYSPSSWCWVSPGRQHFTKLIDYFARVGFSFNSWIALSFFLPSLFGIWVGLKREREVAIPALAFLFAYLLYFSQPHLMIVRNVLVCLPFFALFSVLGVERLFEMIRSVAVKALLVGFITASMAWNAYWLVDSGWSIGHRPDDNATKAEMQKYVLGKPKIIFYVSPEIRKHWGGALPPQIHDQLDQEVEQVVSFQSELDPPHLKSLHPHFFLTWFGSREVNLNYYPPWFSNKIVVVSARDAEKIKPEWSQPSPRAE
jgi:Dolichyl-phosphate-mannose-protein mannosyltransferase